MLINIIFYDLNNYFLKVKKKIFKYEYMIIRRQFFFKITFKEYILISYL